MKFVRLFFQLLFLFSLITGIISATQEKIKIYALYSDSHAVLVNDWFLPSLTAINDPLLELNLLKVEQVCPSGVFLQQGWTDAMLGKVNLIIRAIEENPDQIFIYADVDIQFFAPFSTLILKLMQDNDMIIQRNNPQGDPCAGFFACRANEKTHALWTQVKKDMQASKQGGDQGVMSIHLKSNRFKVQWKLLPSVFYGAGTLTGMMWVPKQRLRFPKEPLILHHANFTEGIAYKIAQLTDVKKYVENQKQKTICQKEHTVLRTTPFIEPLQMEMQDDIEYQWCNEDCLGNENLAHDLIKE